MLTCTFAKYHTLSPGLLYVLCLLVHSLNTTHSPPGRLYVLCLLVHSLNTTHSSPGRPLSLLPSLTLSYDHWSDKEKVLLPLADQFKILRNKLKFPWEKNVTQSR